MLDELEYAMKRMERCKTPGCDGLGVEVYSCAWQLFGPELLKALQFAFEKGELHLSARRVIISLMPKKDRDNRFTKNYRPLTLLNTNYKILAKAITYRIQPYLDQLIHVSQTGFMRGRNIANEQEMEAIIVSLDFEKAFDRVELTAVEGALRFFNFGEVLINWVLLLCNNVLINRSGFCTWRNSNIHFTGNDA